MLLRKVSFEFKTLDCGLVSKLKSYFQIHDSLVLTFCINRIKQNFTTFIMKSPMAQ